MPKIYERGAPFVRHAHCPIFWLMIPTVWDLGDVMRVGPFLPKPHAFEDWPRWAKNEWIHINQQSQEDRT